MCRTVYCSMQDGRKKKRLSTWCLDVVSTNSCLSRNKKFPKIHLLGPDLSHIKPVHIHTLFSRHRLTNRKSLKWKLLSRIFTCHFPCISSGSACNAEGSEWGRRGGRIGSWWGNRRERDYWGDLAVDGWIILGCISRRWDVGIWTGLGWPRIGTGGGSL